MAYFINDKTGQWLPIIFCGRSHQVKTSVKAEVFTWLVTTRRELDARAEANHQFDANEATHRNR